MLKMKNRFSSKNLFGEKTLHAVLNHRCCLKCLVSH
ncbi:DUF2127 domain-containing protein, partial [Yersinia pestis]